MCKSIEKALQLDKIEDLEVQIKVRFYLYQNLESANERIEQIGGLMIDVIRASELNSSVKIKAIRNIVSTYKSEVDIMTVVGLCKDQLDSQVLIKGVLRVLCSDARHFSSLSQLIGDSLMPGLKANDMLKSYYAIVRDLSALLAKLSSE